MKRDLTGSEGKRTLMIERRRLELFRFAQAFLSENGAPGFTDASR